MYQQKRWDADGHDNDAIGRQKSMVLTDGIADMSTGIERTCITWTYFSFILAYLFFSSSNTTTTARSDDDDTVHPLASFNETIESDPPEDGGSNHLLREFVSMQRKMSRLVRIAIQFKTCTMIREEAMKTYYAYYHSTIRSYFGFKMSYTYYH